MIDERLILPVWDTITSAQREEIAHAIGERLPSPFQFKEMKMHSQAQQSHEIAFYDWNGADFALIPGGIVTLGYDRKTFRPTQEQFEDWGTAEEGTLSHTLEEHVDECLTLLRQAKISPFLLEVEAKEQGVTPLSSSDPAVIWAYPKHLSPGWTVPTHSRGRSIRYVMDEDRNVTAEETRPVTYEETVQQVAAQGFRLPTSDEWETACAAGSRTLFRWGDECPLDFSPFEAASHAEWLCQAAPYVGRNAFGLQIAVDPHNWEFCNERGVMRGGDFYHDAMKSKFHLCRGKGTFADWLSLAPAYIGRNFRVPPEGTEFHGAYLRRALSLP